MKTNSKLLIVIAMMVVCGSLLTPKSGFGAENQNSVASISTLEMGHFSKENGVLKWIPQKQPKVHKVADGAAFSSDPLVNQQIQFGLWDANIIKCIECSVSGTSVDSVFSNNDLVDLQRSCRCIETRVRHLLHAETQSIPGGSIDNLLALQRACRFMDAGVDRYRNVRVPSCQSDSIQPSTKSKSIVILFENDVHTVIEKYHIMAGLYDAVTASDTAYVGMVSIGDFFHGGAVGAISKGRYIAVILRAMHYDAIVVGNHECDYGVDRLIQLVRDYNLPVVCANLNDMKGNLVFAPYKIVSYGDKKVAFVGVLTPHAEKTEKYAFKIGEQKIYDLQFDNIVNVVQRSVDAARDQGADYVVLLSHVGEKTVWDSVEKKQYPSSYDLVASTRGINVVLDGHTHSVVPCDTMRNKDNELVYISQTGRKFDNIGMLVIPSMENISIKLLPTDSITYSNARVARVIDSINTLVDDSTAYKVFHSDYKLTINDDNGIRMVRKDETNAGDIMVDAVRDELDANIALISSGGFNSDIPSGDITRRQVIDMLPFDDKLMKIQATGAEILDMLRFCTQKLPNEDGNFPQVSGMRFTVRVSDHAITSAEVMQPDGSYALIDPDATYTVASSDYCVYRGEFNKIFAKCPVLETSSMFYWDILAHYINKKYGGNVPAQYAKTQGRITIE